MSILRRLAARPWLIALLMALGVGLWLASGNLGRDGAPTGERTVPDSLARGEETPRVQVRVQRAEPVTRVVTVYGRTAPARTAQLKAETSGRVERIDAARGKPVRQGTPLLRLDLRDREARLEEARANVAQHRTAYEGQLELKAQGYVSDTQLAETLARLESARAELVRAELDLSYRTVRAPFDGVIQERDVEVGDFVRAGDPVLTFVDNLRLIVTGSIAEHEARFVSTGSEAEAVLATGQQVRGRIRYVAPVAQEATRTFTVELEIPNPGATLPAGVTAEMRIPGGTMQAQRLAPSLLALDDAGRIGIKTVDALNRVVFTPVDIVRSDPGAIWVAGLPEAANVIIVGQGYVSAGQQVETTLEQSPAALAVRPAE